jgi:hypothetical protein
MPAQVLRRWFAGLENLHAVDEHMFDTDCILMRLFLCDAIHDGRHYQNVELRLLCLRPQEKRKKQKKPTAELSLPSSFSNQTSTFQ